MSLIADALNKAQRERSQPRGATLYRTPGYRPGYVQPPVRVKSLTFVWLSAGLVAMLLVAGMFYLRSGPTSPGQDPIASTDPAVSPTPTGRPLVKEREPIDLRLAPVAPLSVARSDYELAGMSAVGSTTLLSITRRSDKRSFWVPVGKTIGEITAVSYDATNDRAVIRVNGVAQTIALRDVGSPPAAATQPAE